MAQQFIFLSSDASRVAFFPRTSCQRAFPATETTATKSNFFPSAEKQTRWIIIPLETAVVMETRNAHTH